MSVIRVKKAYDSEGAARRTLSNYPVGDRDCHISVGRLSEKDAMMIYGKPEIWIVSGEWYK